MDDRGLITVGAPRAFEPPPVDPELNQPYVGRMDSLLVEGTVCGAWRMVKQVVHTYARDPSPANAQQVTSAFQALREQQERSQALARWRGIS